MKYLFNFQLWIFSEDIKFFVKNKSQKTENLSGEIETSQAEAQLFNHNFQKIGTKITEFALIRYQ